MATTLSLQRLWTIYKRTSVAYGTGGKRDLAISHLAFYSGARGVLKVLAYLIDAGRVRGAARNHQATGTADREDSGAASARAAALNRTAALLPGGDRGQMGMICQASALHAPIRAPVRPYRSLCPKMTRSRWKARSSRPCPTRLSG
jgi:hypothetical protein